MARKTKRRPYRPPRPQRQTEDAAQKHHRLQAGAQSLLASRTPDQISQELSVREHQLAEADRVAQLDPNPGNLSRYRFALSQFEEAQIAVTLVTGKPKDLSV